MEKLQRFRRIRAILSTINLSRICVAFERRTTTNIHSLFQLFDNERSILQQLETVHYPHILTSNREAREAESQSTTDEDPNLSFLRRAVEACTKYINFLEQSCKSLGFPENPVLDRALTVVLMRLKLVGARWILSTYDVVEGEQDDAEFLAVMNHMRHYYEIGACTFDRDVVTMPDAVGVAANLISNILPNAYQVKLPQACAAAEGPQMALISGKERGVVFRLFMEDLHEVAIVSSGAWMAGSVEPCTPVISIALSQELIPRYPRHFATPTSDEQVKAREEISATAWALAKDNTVLMCKAHFCDRVKLVDGEMPVSFIDLFCALASTEGSTGPQKFCLKNIDNMYNPLNDDGSLVAEAKTTNPTFLTRTIQRMPKTGKEQTMRLRLFLYGTTERSGEIQRHELLAKLNGELFDGTIVKEYLDDQMENIKQCVATENSGVLDDGLQEDFKLLGDYVNMTKEWKENFNQEEEEVSRPAHHALDRRYRKLMSEVKWHREVSLQRPKGYEMKDVTLDKFNYVDNDGIRRRMKADEDGLLTGIRGASQRGSKFGISGRIRIPPLQGIVSYERERKEDVMPHMKRVLSYLSQSKPTAAVRMALQHMEILNYKKSSVSVSYIPNGDKDGVVVDHIEAIKLRVFNDVDAYYNPKSKELVVKTFKKLYKLEKVGNVEGKGMYQLTEETCKPGKEFMLCSMSVAGGLLA